MLLCSLRVQYEFYAFLGPCFSKWKLLFVTTSGSARYEERTSALSANAGIVTEQTIRRNPGCHIESQEDGFVPSLLLINGFKQASIPCRKDSCTDHEHLWTYVGTISSFNFLIYIADIYMISAWRNWPYSICIRRFLCEVIDRYECTLMFWWDQAMNLQSSHWGFCLNAWIVDIRAQYSWKSDLSLKFEMRRSKFMYFVLLE